MPTDPALPVPRSTLARVAAEAAVSVPTVSKVLNGRSGVAPETRERVEGALRAHGYSRRVSAASSVRLIELVMPAIASITGLEIITGVERAARSSGRSMVLTQSGDRRSPGRDWIDGALRRRPEGVVLVFSDLAPDDKRRLRTRGIPFVVIDPSGDPAPDVPSVGSANWSGGYSATRHLIDLGHVRIAAITGPEGVLSSTARLSGYRAALESAGIPLDESLVLRGNYQYGDGLARGLELLERRDRPTAVFAGTDVQAMGVYEAARRRGVAIPAELSVVGYDDIRVAAWANPPLTTVLQPLAQMGEEATRLVIRLSEGEPAEASRVDLSTTLVVRDSTTAPSTTP
ncbi:LacI family DNA-binding transcriptional regulator [Pseudolysinimonas kribbensis]|uniref:LacI family DNA-binding transcriptional regulator n=1 Tax=Pseudolysinimonas kribbensis TaxID=433641 RepID=UPI0031DA03E3